jgi:hypothetical protein
MPQTSSTDNRVGRDSSHEFRACVPTYFEISPDGGRSSPQLGGWGEF